MSLVCVLAVGSAALFLPELKTADLTNRSAASHTQWTFQEKTG